MAHNQVVMQRADRTLLSDEQSVRSTCVFLYMLPAQVHLQKGKSECCGSNSGKHFVASAGRTHQASLLQVPWTALPINPCWESQCSAIRDALFMSGNCLYFVGIIYCVFLWPIYQIVVLFWGVKKKIKRKKDNGVEIFMNVNGGCGRNPWSVTNLCPVALLQPLRDIWMYAWLPPAPRSSHDLYCTSSSSFWVVLQENVCHQPLNMCLNDISPVCLWECLFPRDDWILVSVDRDYRDDQIRGAKCVFLLLFFCRG